MAKTRMLNTRFWNDNFVSSLDPIEKLLFVYFITNEHTNICGIYELPLKIAAIETGIDASMFDKIMPRLAPKVYYVDGWIILPNFPKHQASKMPKVQRGIEIALESIPTRIMEKAIPYGYPMDTHTMYSDSDSDSEIADKSAKYKKKPMRKYNENEHAENDLPSLDLDSREISTPLKEKKSGRVTPEMEEVFALFYDQPARALWPMREIERVAAQTLFKEYGVQVLKKRYEIARKHKSEKLCPQINKPSDFLDKMPNMENFLENI